MELLHKRLKEYEPVFREYHIMEQIGSGGSSRVYRAESATGHQVAIKAISIPSTDEWETVGGDNASVEKAAALVRGSEELLQRTRREYEYAQKLERSDYTVKVLDFEEKHFPLLPNVPIMGTDILIRMDWQDCDLDQLAKEKSQPFSEQEILQVGHDVVSALMDLHAYNMKHRDVKPKNIFVSDYHGRRYKLGDFGSAYIATGNTMEAHPSAGTRGFMAPEERSGRPEFSSDLYSVGIVLYWMASGAVPDSNADVSRWKRPEGLSDGIWAVIQTACAHLPEDRFLSASDMRNNLDQLNPDLVPTPVDRKIIRRNDEKKIMMKNTVPPTNRKMSALGFAAILASVLLLAASAIGLLGHTLNRPVSEAEFSESYYAQNEEFDNMQSDYTFEVKTDGAVKGAYLGVSAPSVSAVPFGGEISVTLTYTGDVASVLLGSGSIVLNDFCATKTLRQISDNEIKLLLTNVQAAETGDNSPKSISITGGTGINPSGSLANNVTSSEFMITPTTMETLLGLLYDAWIYLMVLGLIFLGLARYTRKGQKT